MTNYAFRLAATSVGASRYDLWVVRDGREEHIGIVTRVGGLPESAWLKSWDPSLSFDAVADVSFDFDAANFDVDTGDYDAQHTDTDALGVVSSTVPVTGEQIEQSAAKEEIEQEISVVEGQLDEFDTLIGDYDDVIGDAESMIGDIDDEISLFEDDASLFEDTANEIDRAVSDLAAIRLDVAQIQQALDTKIEEPPTQADEQREDPVDKIMEAGEPVRAHSGAMVREETDIFVEGRGLNFSFVRFYNSQCYSDGILGRKWRHCFEDRLHIFESGRILRVTPRGDTIYYPKATDTAWTPSSGANDLLTRSLAGGYQITDGEGLQRNFDRAGLLMSIEDRYGNHITLDYDDGQLISARDTLDHHYAFEYLGDGRLDSIIDHFGRVVHYAYEDGVLVRARGNPPGPGLPGPEWNYEYVSGPDPRTYALLSAVRDIDGNALTENDYGLLPSLWTFNRVWRQVVRGGSWYFDYDFPEYTGGDTESGGTTRITTPDGLVRETRFDSRGRPVTISEEYADHETGQPRSASSSIEYDSEGRMVRHTDMAGLVSEFDYLGGSPIALQRHLVSEKRLISVNGDTLTTRYEYGAHNQLLAFENEAGARTEYELDANANVLRIIYPESGDLTPDVSFEYDQWGNIVARTDPRGLRTEFRYASFDGQVGLLSSIIEDVGDAALETVYERDITGVVKAIVQPDGTRVSLELDQRSQVVSRSIDGVELWHGAYDHHGRLVTEGERRLDFNRQPLSPEWVEKTFTRDIYGQVSRAEVMAGGTIIATREYEWDAMGRMVAEMGPGTNHAVIAYDMRGNPATITRSPGTAQEATKYFRYDDAGAIDQIERAEGYSINFLKDGFGRSIGSRDSRGIEDHFALDASGHITGLERLDSGGVLRFAARYGFNPLGLETESAIAEVDATGAIVGWRESRSTYDEGLARTSYESAAGLTVTESHNKFGELIEQKDNLGNRIVFSHDEFGRMTGASTDYLTPENDTVTLVTERVYDEDGETIENIDPLGNRTQTRTSLSGARSSVTREDGAVLSTATEPSRYAAINSRAHLGQKVTEEWVSNAQGQLVEYVDAAGNVLTSAYDSNGRLVETRDGEARVTGSFAYDSLGRVESATDGRGVVSTIEYDELNRPITERFSGVGITPLERSFDYDDMGRLASVSTADSLLQMEYDSFGRLIRHVQDGIETIRSYDDDDGSLTIEYADGRRLSIVRDPLGRTTEISIDGAKTTAQYSGTGGLWNVGDGVVSVRHRYDAGGRLIMSTSTVNGLDTNSVTLRNSAGQVVVSLEGDDGIFIERDFLDRIMRTRRINSAADIYADVDTLAQDTQSGIDAYIASIPLGDDVSSYSYDAVGNRLSDDSQSYSYDRSNRLLGDAQYDGAGNLIFDGKFRYRYDGAGMVEQVDDEAGNPLVSFKRDGLGQVIGFSELGRDWRIERDGNNPVRYVCDTDGEQVDISWGIQSDQILALSALGARYRFAYTHRGDVAAVFDEAGNLVEAYRYNDFGSRTVLDPNGDERESSVLAPASHGFAAHRMLNAGELLDTQARLYKTSSGRFTALDPSGLADGANPYVYAHNDPYTFIDRDGRSATVTGLGIGLIVGSVYATGHCMWDLGWAVAGYDTFNRGYVGNFTYYTSEIFMIAGAGAAIGLAVDTAPVWGGLLSAGLMGAGMAAGMSVVANGPDLNAYTTEGLKGGALGVGFFALGAGGTALAGTAAGRQVISGVVTSRPFQLAAQAGRGAYGYGSGLASRGMNTWVGKKTAGYAKGKIDKALEFMVKDAEGSNVARWSPFRWTEDLSAQGREAMAKGTYRARGNSIIDKLADDIHPADKYTGKDRISDFWAMQQFKDEVMDALTPPTGGWANHSAFAKDFWAKARSMSGYADHFADPSKYGYAGRVMRPASNGGQFLESIHIHHLRPKSIFKDISTLRENLVLLPQSTHNSFVHTKRYLYTGWGSSLQPRDAMRQALRQIFPRQWEKGVTAGVVSTLINLPELNDLSDCP